MPPTKTKTSATPPTIPPTEGNDQKKCDDLLKEAMKHPGVADVVRLYEASGRAEQSLSAYQLYQNIFPESVTSSSTAPVPL